MRKILFLILLAFINNFTFSNKSYAGEEGPKEPKTINQPITDITKDEKTVSTIQNETTTTTDTNIDSNININTNTDKSLGQKFKEITNDIDDFMSVQWEKAKIFWDNWDSDENIQLTTFELPKIVIPKITFPKLDDVKFYPIKNKNIFIYITPKNEIETKIITKTKDVLQLSNKITENKETADTILTGQITEKHKEISNNLTSYGLKLKLHFITNQNEKRNIILNVDNSINNTDFISLQEQVLNALYKKIENTFNNK